MNASCLHVDLDGAWPREALGDAPYLDCREWGAALRYSTTRRLVRDLQKHVAPQLAAFTLYGSGDYHYLSALWLQRCVEPLTLVSFDNHPDWDVRPPFWCCGTWINRALTLPHVRGAMIWGCGNFELNWPNWLFANHTALRAQRLRVWPWTERLNASARKRWPGLARGDWRTQFADFSASLAGEKIYVTVDLDCLNNEHAVTNWENGLFTRDDLAWALRELRQKAQIVGGDLCGAYSPVRYARFKQAIEGRLDHPALPPIDPAVAAHINAQALATIWPVLTGRNERDPETDQTHSHP